MPACTSRIRTGSTCKFPRGDGRKRSPGYAARLPTDQKGRDLLPTSVIRAFVQASSLAPHDTVSEEPIHGVITCARCDRSAVVPVVALGAAVVLVARSGVDGDATQVIISLVAEMVGRRAADLAAHRRHDASVATDRYIDLVPDRVGSAGASKEIVIVAGIVPGFVGPALACNDLDGATIAVIDDQRIRAAAAESNLVIRADSKPLRSEAACGLRVDRECLLDVERCIPRNPHDDPVTRDFRRCRPGHWNGEIELPVARIELALLDAVG